MKNILILADGLLAKNFIEWLSKTRVAENRYYVSSYTANTIPEKLATHITQYNIDPTSFLKLSRIMSNVKFSEVFIIIDKEEDALFALKNIVSIDKTIRVLFVNIWDNEEIKAEEYENITIFTPNDLIAAHLYDQLPNVPIIAKNVGLGKGEIMEIHVPFGSTYAFRHVGSILQRKWKITAIYRNEKQIIPTNATMIRPNDLLLVIGNPVVLDGVYKTINKRIGLFPEPFGKNLYLILDFSFDVDNAVIYLKESLYLLNKLEDKSLIVRIINPNNFDIIDEIKSYECDNVSVMVCYDEDDVKKLIEFDIQEHEIGLILNSTKTFQSDSIMNILYELKKIVYIFGDKLLYNVKKCIILMGENDKMESISSTAFDISESLNLELSLADFDPEGDFEDRKIIIDHYETLSHIFNMDVNIVQKIANPIREISEMDDILQIAPFEKEFKKANFLNFISTKVQDFLLSTKRHPRLIVPYALGENKE
ncbi:TrkA domain protein [hydrothermal vent metagenome]|uniref:TrkA domain protein n=1 Tax=hydrothermal vent metagenome TaxID=652676 RepID=A0A1W1EBM0_9ZZZZ